MSFKITEKNGVIDIITGGVLINGKPLMDATKALFYPIGSIYLSVNDTSPSALFGGEWEQIENRFLLACSIPKELDDGSIDYGDYPLGKEDGSADAVVVEHSHTIIQYQDNYSWYVYLAESGNDRYGVSLDYSAQRISGSDVDIFRAKSVGVSGVGKNMPPYIAVKIWKRIS